MYYRYLIKIAFAFALVIAISAPSFAADDSGKGSVNWTDGFIESVGYGTASPSGNRAKDRINSRRVAVVSAQRALLETIKGVMIDSVTTVENSMLKEDHIRTRVAGVIKGAHIIDEKFTWEGNSPVFIVKMRICLSGGFAECNGTSLVNVLGLEKREDPPFVPKTMLTTVVLNNQESARPIARPPLDTASHSGARRFAHDATKPVTGVILTLEGRHFERSLLPVVITRMNDEMVTVYSAKVVKPSVIREYGAVRYAETIDNAVKISHLGSNVLVVPVADISKDNMIIIGSQDAATIKETLAHGNNYLGEAKVVITVR